MKYNYTKRKNDYITPPEIIQQVLKEHNKTEFDLDVCCSFENIPAKNHYINGVTDGLTADWAEFNWCNPPFDECEKWVKKAAKEQEKLHTSVMLIPARTETKYWHDYILCNGYAYRNKVTVKFLKKGFKFIEAETNKEMGIFKNALALVTFRAYNDGFFCSVLTP